jgi:hypothetical protein
MKKQINPSSKAHLLRSALILLSLVTFNQDIFSQQPTPTATATPTPTPTPTASVCPRPTPGTCVSYEAESDDNILTGSAFVLSCPTCSNGFKVGYVGNNSGTLEFDAIGIVVPGRHSMTICYTNGDPVRYALLSVNGNQGMPLTFPSTGSFQTVGSIQTDVVLNTGCNTLEFYNPNVGSWAPDFDRIQFNCPTCALPPTPLTCTPIVVAGSIAGSDPTQTGGPVTSFVPPTCPPSRVCQIFDTTPLHYDAYRFTNTTGSTQCVTIDTMTPCRGSNSIFTAAYRDTFNPANICTNWIGDSGSPPNPERAFQVQVLAGQTFVVVVSEFVPDAGCLSYTVTITANCQSPSPTPTPTPTPGAALGNVSTRSLVQTGDNVMIGGLIVQGTQPKRVILRAIGPELSQYGVPNAMANPTLELHDNNGALIASNNDWQTTIIGGIITSDQVQDIQNSGHAPQDARESAIMADLPPGNYTAIVRGVNNAMGVALVEAYDLSPTVNSILGNLSTRASVQTGDNTIIGGFIVQGTQPKNVIIRAIGRELSQYGVPDPLANPTLELHNGSGALIASNDNWQHTIIGGVITHDQVQDIQNSGHAPADASESAIIANLPPGNYTAIVRGVNNTTGVALVEVYDLH